MGLNRREFICGCGSSVLLAACGGGGDSSSQSSSTPTRNSQQVRGCGFSSTFFGAGYPSCGIVPTSGDALVDSAFSNEFGAQKSFWGLPNVGFTFLNDCDGANAYATPDTKFILFGINMVRKIYFTFGTTLPLWQVVAHEFGHQVQFALGDGWLDAPTVAPKELEADMFSGFYILLAKTFSSAAETQAVLANAFSLGEFMFNSPIHHGTPLQRTAAVVAGARVASEYYDGRIPRTYPAVRTRFAQELIAILNG